MYDIDVIGYQNGCNKLHLFDVESIDESLVKNGISFDKKDIAHNLTYSCIRMTQMKPATASDLSGIFYGIQRSSFILKECGGERIRSEDIAGNIL